ncbi:MAG TPA: Ig-like domain-containing protein [Nitrososphaerales archaeon]|nr:Ig-like domain-containing protein [Nitrososphaerales archaeon]
MNKAMRAATLTVLMVLAVQVLPFSAAAASPIPGLATGLVLTLVPPKLPADGATYPAVIISLQDAGGLPTVASSDITVFLASSQTNIVAVPNSVIISAGQEYAIANVTTTTTPGLTSITAHSEGLNPPSPPSEPLQTVTPSGFPSKLVVFTSPSTFLPRTDTGVVRVEVVDDAGLPSKAINSIPVLLSTSNSSIASLGQTSLTIPAGNIFADGTFSTSNPGAAVITAATTGFSSGTGLVTVNKPVLLGSNSPSKLALRVVPRTLPTDGNSYRVLEVALQTNGGTPAVSSSDTIIQLTSDKSEVVSVPGLVTIPAGSISTLAALTTSALAGSANVTATSGGLLPTGISIHTVIPAPSKLQAYVAPPSSAFSTYASLPILVVQLQDSSGNPARARQTTSITMTSSNGSLLSSFVTLTVPTGKDYVFSYLNVKGVGTSLLSFTSQGLTSSQANLKTVPNPLVVRLLLSSTPNGFIFANQTATFTFSATFVGQPLKNTNVTWTTTGGTILPQTGNTGESGTVTTVFTPASYGKYNITASATSPQTGNIHLLYSLVVAQVPPKPSPTIVQLLLTYWYYLAAAAAVVVIALVYLFRLRRRKQRAEIEAGFEVV